MTSALDMPEIMSYIYSKSWKLQFSASSSIIIIEDYYLQTFLHSLMFCAALTMLVTVKMHTPNLAICIPFFLLCMMPFIARVLPAFDAFFNLLPTVLTNIFNAVRTPILFQIGSFVFRQISLLMFLYILLFIVLLPLIYIGYSRYGLKKK